MERRQFIIALAQSIAAVTAYYPLGAYPQSKGSRHLVDTPEKRAAYLARVLEILCTDIGPRIAGSPQYDKSAELIKREMDLTLPITELDWFGLRGWQLLEAPIFYCGSKSLESYPFFGSTAPPEQGARGVLRKGGKDEPAYALVDPSLQKTVAYISISPFGRAVPNFVSPSSKMAAVPTLSIGKQDVPVLEQAMANATGIRIHFKVEFDDDARSCNIVGTLPGETDEEILLLAHADTTYNTPGANDNTASVVVLLMLAHALAGTTPKRTVTFVATGAEECGLVGAKHYAARRKAEGTLHNIKYCINFDSLTYGPNLYIHSNSTELTGIMASIYRDMKLYNAYDPSYPIGAEYFSTVRDLDAMFFRDAGAQTLDINSRGYDEKNLPLWHSPEDRATTVPLDCVENSFLIFDECLKRIQLL